MSDGKIVACIGSSSTAGRGQAFDWIGELRGRPRNDGIRFANFGVGGDLAYNALQHVSLSGQGGSPKFAGNEGSAFQVRSAVTHTRACHAKLVSLFSGFQLGGILFAFGGLSCRSFRQYGQGKRSFQISADRIMGTGRLYACAPAPPNSRHPYHGKHREDRIDRVAIALRAMCEVVGKRENHNRTCQRKPLQPILCQNGEQTSHRSKSEKRREKYVEGADAQGLNVDILP